MTSTQDAHLKRWTFFYPVSKVGAFAPGQGISDYFVSHPDIGSPIGPEEDWDDVHGGRIQVFSGGVVGYDPANGTREIVE